MLHTSLVWSKLISGTYLLFKSSSRYKFHTVSSQSYVFFCYVKRPMYVRNFYMKFSYINGSTFMPFYYSIAELTFPEKIHICEYCSFWTVATCFVSGGYHPTFQKNVTWRLDKFLRNMLTTYKSAWCYNP